jgi:antitoxin ParD1/3/4
VLSDTDSSLVKSETISQPRLRGCALCRQLVSSSTSGMEGGDYCRCPKWTFLAIGVKVEYMNVSLTPELNQFIAEKVKGGFYSSAIEVIREGLRLLKQYDEIQRVKLQQLRADIEKGIASLDGGKGKPLDIEAIKAEGRKRRKAAKKARK